MATTTARPIVHHRPRSLSSKRNLWVCLRHVYQQQDPIHADSALGMVVGTASLILVVTVGLTGKQYVLNLVQAIGANMIYADYRGGAQRINARPRPDPPDSGDMQAVSRRAHGVGCGGFAGGGAERAHPL